jgi:hypothetical protein
VGVRLGDAVGLVPSATADVTCSFAHYERAASILLQRVEMKRCLQLD